MPCLPSSYPRCANERCRKRVVNPAVTEYRGTAGEVRLVFCSSECCLEAS